MTAEELAPFLDPPALSTPGSETAFASASAFGGADTWGAAVAGQPRQQRGAAGSRAQAPPPVTSAPYKDESFVLPALLRLGGEPFVDEQGRLLYRFPSLQRTSVARVRSGGGGVQIGACRCR